MSRVVGQPAIFTSHFPYAFNFTGKLTRESDEPKARGGFGEVYQYRDPRTNGLLYAVKEITNGPDGLTLSEVCIPPYG